MIFEGQLVIKDYTKISDWLMVDGVIVDEPNWTIKNQDCTTPAENSLCVCISLV